MLGGVEERGWRWKSEAEGERLRQYWDGEGGLRARRVAAGMRLGMQADKAFEWFRKQKDKLNAMVREHVQRLPRDVGQALTARPNAKNGGRINKIMADEVARFKPNPFTYQDTSIRWKHGVATERIKQQRAMVKKALQRAEQLRADAAALVAGRGPGAHVPAAARGVSGAARADPHGIDLLAQRLAADEALTHAARTPKQALADERRERLRAVARDGRRRQALADPVRARKHGAQEQQLQQRCLRLYLDVFGRSVARD